MSKVMRVKLKFIDSILGTAPADASIHETYIASQAPDAKSKKEEIAALGHEEVLSKGRTVFPRDPDTGIPVIWNYQIKGFFKSACSALRKVDGTKSKKLKAYKKEIDLRIFVFEHAENKAGRMIHIGDFSEIGSCQRPLRASTPQGERVAIADSDEIPAGATLEFDIEMLNPDDEGLVKEWLDYGAYNGLGQWRNSGKGSFTWEVIA